MRFRRLGRTGLDISECTIGTSGLAEGREASAALAYAFDRGVNALEMAAGDGDAVGKILKREGGRKHVHVFVRATSLVPFDLPSPHVHAQQAYPGAHLRPEVEALLRRLGIERLALLQIHAWCPEWLHEGDWRETLDRLREEGKIAGIGVSLFDHDVDAAREIVASGAVDAVQLMYNVFDQGAARAMLPLCAKQDIGVIARSPLYYGALAPAFSPPADWRRDYFYDEHLRETRERVRRLELEVEPPDSAVSDLALRFALSHPAVTTVAVGMRTPAHVDASLDAIERGPLTAEACARLAGHKWLC